MENAIAEICSTDPCLLLKDCSRGDCLFSEESVKISTPYTRSSPLFFEHLMINMVKNKVLDVSVYYFIGQFSSVNEFL
jgi:hypothetical protein